jgi:hypothetical protein
MVYAISISAQLTEDLTEWRKKKAEVWGQSNPPVPTNYGHIFIAEVAYGVLFVASLVETIIRGVFFIPSLAIVILLSTISERNRVSFFLVDSILLGTQLSFANSLACIVALFSNITHKDLSYFRDLQVISININD